jgi:pimeloyl-ACP methyl ester carboxylesterase
MPPTPYHPFRTAEDRERYLAALALRDQRWPVPSETRMVDTSWARTFVRISGPAEAPPLVLLHGMATNASTWEPNVAVWSTAFRTYAVDNPYDIGRSVYLRDARGADDCTSWLDELFTALGLGNEINLAGMSYGGWLTSRYALRFPDRLAKAVLLVPALTVQPVRLIWVARCLLSTVHRSLSRNFANWTLHDAMAKNAYCRQWVEEVSSDGFACAHILVPRKYVLPKKLSDQEWQSLHVPMLVLVGEHEKHYSPTKAVRRLNRVAPQVKIEVISGAGHDLTLVQADVVNQKVLEFLRSG